MNGKKGTIEIESDNKLSMRDRSKIKKLLPQRLEKATILDIELIEG